MVAAIVSAVFFEAVSDDAAPAMPAGGSKFVDRTFETIKRMSMSVDDDLKRLIVVVSAVLACSHLLLLCGQRERFIEPPAHSLKRPGANQVRFFLARLCNFNDVLSDRLGLRVVPPVFEVKKNQRMFVGVSHAPYVFGLEGGVLKQAINGHGIHPGKSKTTLNAIAPIRVPHEKRAPGQQGF
jgi:hypothetical protein